MGCSKEEMISRVEAYFLNVDQGDVKKVLEQMTPECEITVITEPITHSGRDIGIKDMFERRFENTSSAWHGNFRHLADEERGWVTSRFDVQRTGADGHYREMDNINFFEFDGSLISRITIWMSGENSLK